MTFQIDSYEARVAAYEAEGMTTSDAQAVADADEMLAANPTAASHDFDNGVLCYDPAPIVWANGEDCLHAEAAKVIEVAVNTSAAYEQIRLGAAARDAAKIRASGLCEDCCYDALAALPITHCADLEVDGLRVVCAKCGHRLWSELCQMSSAVRSF